MATNNNIERIMTDHKNRMNKIKRDGARIRIITCPLIAFVFAVMAWYSYASHINGYLFTGSVYAFCSFAFIAMLIGGAIFDRPLK